VKFLKSSGVEFRVDLLNPFNSVESSLRLMLKIGGLGNAHGRIITRQTLNRRVSYFRETSSSKLS
jgi:hypothetical protein